MNSCPYGLLVRFISEKADIGHANRGCFLHTLHHQYRVVLPFVVLKGEYARIGGNRSFQAKRDVSRSRD